MRGFDDDDRLVTRTVTAGAASIHDDQLTRDPSGRVTHAVVASGLSGLADEVRLAYSGMGPLIGIARTRGGGTLDEFDVDAGGHVMARVRNRGQSASGGERHTLYEYVGNA